MKLAVINFSGNVGKTTIARHLLAPRIPGARVLAVESINADEEQDQILRGRQFAELQEYLQVFDDVVVDIGASNVEELMSLMHRYRGSHLDFDCFVVPTVPALKQQQDTIATLAELARIGVPATRMRLVFNQVEDDSPIEQTFEPLFAYCLLSSVVQPRPAARMTQNEIYARVRHAGRSLIELAADATDYKAAIAKASPAAERLGLAQQLATQRLARGVVPELDACFDALELQSGIFDLRGKSALSTA